MHRDDKDLTPRRTNQERTSEFAISKPKDFMITHWHAFLGIHQFDRKLNA